MGTQHFSCDSSSYVTIEITHSGKKITGKKIELIQYPIFLPKIFLPAAFLNQRGSVTDPFWPAVIAIPWHFNDRLHTSMSSRQSLISVNDLLNTILAVRPATA